MPLTADDIEIRYVGRDGIYDVFVRGRFKNFFKSFEEAVKETERLRRMNPIETWKNMGKKGGKVR